MPKDFDSALPFETLHCHTTCSDGLLSYSEVLDACQRNKIGIVAFTDHDSLPTEEQIESLKELNHTVHFISGIEMSCDFIKEYDGKLPTFHVTGLFVDITNKNLKKFCQDSVTARLRRGEVFVERLRDLGFEISIDEILKEAGRAQIGRPHMVAALSKNPKNKKILEMIYLDLKREAEINPERRKLVQEIEARGEPQIWYALVLGEEAYRSIYVNYHEEFPVDMENAVKLIRDAGGVALVAHWSYLRDKFTIDLVEKYLQESRIDGMETVYAIGKGDTAIREVFDQDMKTLSLLCEKYKKIQGGGGDFHKGEDFNLMSDPECLKYAQKTQGMVKRILQLYPNLNLTWTTIKT